jgi:gluconolactonase
MWDMTRVLLLALLVNPLFSADSPIAPGAKPVNLGSVAAGEGPAWTPQGELLFTGQNRITRRAKDGSIHIFREPSGGANGLLFDLQERLIACEANSRRVTRTEADGKITVLADQYEGHRFNQPNDLTIDSKGRIYFTDPRYGKRDDMEMRDSTGQLVEGVYRIDAPGKLTRVIGREMERPNGILVSPDDKTLYVADNNNNNAGGSRKLVSFHLNADGGVDLKSRKVIFDWQEGRGPDGFKMDEKGRLFVAAGRTKAAPPYETDKYKGGVYVFSPEGKLLETIPIPVDEVTNCAFGDADLRTLYVTAGGTLWSIRVDTPGRVSFRR